MFAAAHFAKNAADVVDSVPIKVYNVKKLIHGDILWLAGKM